MLVFGLPHTWVFILCDTIPLFFGYSVGQLCLILGASPPIDCPRILDTHISGMTRLKLKEAPENIEYIA
jgi:hypothetical protein